MQHTDHMQQADLLLQFWFKTGQFVQAGFGGIRFGAGQAELTNRMIAWRATIKQRKEEPSVSLKSSTVFFQ